MIGAVVLAAGRSTRMGTQKLLLPLGGKPVIARIVDELLLSPLEEIVVVIRRDETQIRQALAPRIVSFVENPDPDGDMLTSVRCGVRTLPQACEAILVALGDQPGFTHELVNDLIRAFQQSGRRIIVPAHGERRGHPLLFSASLRDELLTRFDGVGLRGLLDRHAEEIFELAVATGNVLDDIDTPEDYRRHLSTTNG